MSLTPADLAERGPHILALCMWALLSLRLLRLARSSTPHSPAQARGAEWFLFAAAAACRFAHAARFAQHPLFHTPMVDAQFYHLWAQALARGVDPHPVFGVDPLYPYLLGGLYRMAGESPWIPALAGIALGAIAVRGVFRLALRTSSLPVAVWIGSAAALYGPGLYLDPLPLKSALALALTVTALDAYLESRERGSWRLAIAGALTGLAVLNGTQSLVLGAIFAADTAWRTRSATRVLVLTVSLAATGSLALWHNMLVGHDAVLTHCGSGMILWSSNNPGALGRFHPPPYVRPHPTFEVPDYIAHASRELGRELRPSETSAYYRDLALEHMRADPGRASRLAIRKLGLLLNAYEYPDNYDFSLMQRIFPVLALPLPGWGWVAPLGLLGLALAPGPAGRRAPGSRLLALALTALALPYVITYSNDRLRYPLVGCLFPLAALALKELVTSRGTRLALLLGSWAALLAAIHGPTQRVVPLTWSFDLGHRFIRQHETTAAMEIYALLVEANPGDSGALLNLGSLLQAEGDHSTALVFLRRAVVLAPGEGLHHFALGHSLRRSGHAADAAAAYARGLQLLPGEPGIQLKLGLACREAGRLAEARAHLEAALHELASGRPHRTSAGDEERAEAHLALADLLEQAGDAPGAARHRGAAQELLPSLRPR